MTYLVQDDEPLLSQWHHVCEVHRFFPGVSARVAVYGSTQALAQTRDFIGHVLDTSLCDQRIQISTRWHSTVRYTTRENLQSILTKSV